MTCVVGLVGQEGPECGKVLLAADSAAVAGKEIYGVRTSKVFRSGPYAIGYTTSFRLGQIVYHGAELPPPPRLPRCDERAHAKLERFLATDFVMALRLAFADHGLDPAMGESGSLLVGLRGQLFAIGSDFKVLSGALPYAAVGSGRHHAYGALMALEGSGLGLEERAITALRAAERFSTGVRGPFRVIEA